MRISYVTVLSALAVIAHAADNTVTHPTGSETVPIGATYTVSWNPTTSGDVSLILGHGSGSSFTSLFTIADNVINSGGSYQWPVSSTVSPGGGYVIKVLVEGSNNDASYSDSFNLGSGGSSSGSSTTSSSSSGSTTSSSSSSSVSSASSVTDISTASLSTSSDSTSSSISSTPTKAPSSSNTATSKATSTVQNGASFSSVPISSATSSADSHSGAGATIVWTAGTLFAAAGAVAAVVF